MGRFLGPRLGRAEGSWRVALLQHHWSRGWQPRGLAWGLGLWESPGSRQGQSGLVVPRGHWRWFHKLS